MVELVVPRPVVAEELLVVVPVPAARTPSEERQELGWEPQRRARPVEPQEQPQHLDHPREELLPLQQKFLA